MILPRLIDSRNLGPDVPTFSPWSAILLNLNPQGRVSAAIRFVMYAEMLGTHEVQIRVRALKATLANQNIFQPASES